MKIIEIELKNFRSFYGTQTIRFSTSEEKNITLIHAENGVGKTTLLNSILWCFFKKFTADFEEKSELLNREAADNSETTYHVAIVFEDNGNIYRVQRIGSKGSRDVKFHLFKEDETGNLNPISSPESHINAIIPKDMAEYFFFHAEGVSEIVNGVAGNAKEAIRDVLGFTLAENALASLSKIKATYRKSIKDLDRSIESANAQQAVIDLEKSIELMERDLKDYSDDLRGQKETYDSLTEQLRESDSVTVRENIEKQATSLARLTSINKLLKSAESRKIGYIANYAASTFSKKALDEGINFIDERTYKGTIPAPYNEQLLKDIISEAKCICGSDVAAGSEAFSKISKLLGKAGDPILQSRVGKARAQLTAVKRELDSSMSHFRTVIEEINQLKDDKKQTALELQEAHVIVKNSDSATIANKEEQRTQIFSLMESTNRSLGALKGNIERNKVELEAAKELLDRCHSSDGRILALKENVKFIEQLIDRLSSQLMSSENSSKEMLVTLINDFLKKFFRQDYFVKISPSFEIKLYDNKDRIVPKSKGQGLLLSLTFISALIRISKLRTTGKGDLFTPGVVAPFFVDAPFGELDNTYKESIATELPKSVNQVVFLLSSSHWQGKVESALRDRIGMEYNLVLENRKKSGNITEEKLEINGASFDTVRYGCALDSTIIEEVGSYV
jgi:DNA sulfur modification protein DndD